MPFNGVKTAFCNMSNFLALEISAARFSLFTDNMGSFCEPNFSAMAGVTGDWGKRRLAFTGKPSFSAFCSSYLLPDELLVTDSSSSSSMILNLDFPRFVCAPFAVELLKDVQGSMFSGFSLFLNLDRLICKNNLFLR